MLTHRLQKPAQALARAAVRGMQTFEPLESQVNILKNGKMVMSQGTGGRSSRTGYTVTVFGAAGLAGTALTTRLGQHGTLVVAPYREEIYQRHLKVTGDLGVVNYQEFDLRNIKSIEDSVRHSDVVVNLIGRNWETKNYSFYDVHVEGARRIAQATKDAGVPRFIHVSSHSVDLNSPSAFYATKAAGEEVVKEIIPDATIVRPGPIFGIQDQFLNYMASHNLFLQSNEGKQTVVPTYLLDLSYALEKMVYDDSTAGKLYELNGPERFSIAQIHELVRDAVKKDLRLVNLPRPILNGITKFLQYAAYWEGVITPDIVNRMYVDQVETRGALGYKDLGIEPQRLQDHLLRIVRFHRSNVYLHDSEETDKLRKKETESWSNIVG